jgi:hypothetical protein
MNVRDRMISSRPFAFALGGVLLLVVVIVGLSTALVIRNTYLKMRLSSLCPDYFATEYAWVVDENGRGIDSVAVTLRDNSNINMIYRTFTDSTGRFVLFHDFGSFALYDIPFSYFLYVSAEGWSDTVCYSFERYRVCHFRKKEGPDTIVFNSANRSTLSLRLEQAQRVMIDSGFSFVPYEEIALSSRQPSAVEGTLPFDTVFYTTLSVGAASVGFAVIPIAGYRVLGGKAGLLTEGTYYVIDRNGDRRLTDEVPVQFTGAGNCTVGTCRTTDSISVGAVWYHLDIKVRGIQGNAPLLRYRRADALKGSVMMDSVRYPLLLWDRRCSGYSDRSAVVVGVDRNGDGFFEGNDGGVEMHEDARGRIVFDSVSFVIDTIASNGLRLYCSAIKRGVEHSKPASIGTWTDNFSVAATCPLSLYQECAANRYVLLYFFEGVAAYAMESTDIHTLSTLMRDQLGATRLIGVNRRSAGELYCGDPVINENRGWSGPLVRQFHNHRERELVCLDAGATIVYRGTIGPEAILTIWKHAGADDAVAQSVYEQQFDGKVTGNR